ncbi:glycosyltransferase family 2 protein [Arenimonas fontis]|uniref:Glycosyltransferase family 2 protein n=1 Tax=Arenimonas fontis TaxID=2608255 RepID=A0A5B2ZA06_9GAMM|nr:glycosyltransferase family 2 protein [Arenimonas fontis]KAA2284976.1 glycosyltransferase family 2 protein [Arenimonas fontis]
MNALPPSRTGASAIGVVVVSYRSAATLGTCLRHLLAAHDVERVVVVDNASDDESCAIVERLAEGEPRLSLVRNRHNRGFGAACNQGATALSQPWLAFVNPDAYVEAQTLSRLVEHARARPGAGLLGVELVGEDGAIDPSSRRADPSLRDLLLRFGRRDDLYLGRDPAAPTLQPVDAVSGALMLLPAVLFVRLGGFDEGYRLHAEDLDLCRRVRQAGYEVLVANDLRVTHVRGVSSRRRPFFVEWHKHRGMWRYFRRFEAATVPAWQHPLIWLALWAHFLAAVLRRLVAR